MSKSIYVTHKNIKQLSVKGIYEEAKDPDSDFRQWAKKLSIEDTVPRQRKAKNKNTDL
jgi:hypothetical protein